MPRAKTTAQSRPPAEPRAGLPRFDPGYGLKPRKQYLPWSHATERLAKAHNYWIVTSGPGGKPHAMPVWGFWIDGTLYFGTGRRSRKWRNLEQNPQIVVHLESGDDVVIVEGTAREVPVTEPAFVAKLKALSQKKYGMFMPPDPKEHLLIALQPRVAFAWTEKDFPNIATRWEFPSAAPRKKSKSKR